MTKKCDNVFTQVKVGITKKNLNSENRILYSGLKSSVIKHKKKKKILLVPPLQKKQNNNIKSMLCVLTPQLF